MTHDYLSCINIKTTDFTRHINTETILRYILFLFYHRPAINRVSFIDTFYTKGSVVTITGFLICTNKSVTFKYYIRAFLGRHRILSCGIITYSHAVSNRHCAAAIFLKWVWKKLFYRCKNKKINLLNLVTRLTKLYYP